jgi:hypothetical protein
MGVMGTSGAQGETGERVRLIPLMNGDSDCQFGGTEFALDGGSPLPAMVLRALLVFRGQSGRPE